GANVTVTWARPVGSPALRHEPPLPAAAESAACAAPRSNGPAAGAAVVALVFASAFESEGVRSRSALVAAARSVVVGVVADVVALVGVGVCVVAGVAAGGSPRSGRTSGRVWVACSATAGAGGSSVAGAATGALRRAETNAITSEAAAIVHGVRLAG